MRSYIQSISFLLLLLGTFILASPIQTEKPTVPSTPKPTISVNKMYSLSSRQKMNMTSGDTNPKSSTSSAGAKSTGTSTACSPEVQALASGISSNIADQRDEQKAVTAVGKILQQSPFNTSMFDVAQSSLMTFVQKGIQIRQNNQKIAPAGNSAIPGLAIVAMAQQEELNLTMSLTASNVAGSNATVAKLKTDFAGGIVQNMKNLAAATKGCKMPSTTT
ncbi:hypothetical protein BOTNAR_0093g00230 [Botryotinia narcissicola]|uniref:Uncharacterized protein n=1 Tax=Botryotinia narcissicola TaxID=278944 RepID=A0A4Z1IRL6_9HELO|nr:hypothetical protein BOTNAR_0093g00230 [Botryotinia narcissicola]